MDIALECARLQHRLTMPPLEVEDFPDFYFPDCNAELEGSHGNGGDIVQEILSVASASNELATGQYSSYHENLWRSDQNYHQSSMNEVAAVAHDGRIDDARFLEVTDLEGELKAEKVVENLRGVKFSERYDLDQEVTRNCVPTLD